MKKANLLKITSILIVMVLVASMFSACGASTDSTPIPEDSTNDGSTTESAEAAETPTTDSEGKKPIDFWFDKAFEQPLVISLEESWANNSDYVVTIGNYQDTASYQTAIQQSIDLADGPDIITWWSGDQLETLAKNGKIVDLTDQWPKFVEAGVSPDIQEAFTIDGKAYAAPFSVLYNTCLYNKAAFAAAGIEKAPETFDEFLDACEKLKAAGITPIGIKNDSWASFIWFQEFVSAYDPQLYIDICNGTKKYTDPDMVKVMEVWQDMIAKGYFAEPVYHTDLNRSFSSGEVAMMLEPNTAFAALKSEFGMDTDNGVGSFAVPSMNNKKSVIFFEAAPIAVTSAGDSVDDAVQALVNFYNVETQQVLVDNKGIVNTNTTQLADVAIKNLIEMANDQENYQLMLRYYENTPESIRNLAIDELSKFMYNNSDINTTLETIQVESDKVFGA